jgi:hypothetical protein
LILFGFSALDAEVKVAVSGSAFDFRLALASVGSILSDHNGGETQCEEKKQSA